MGGASARINAKYPKLIWLVARFAVTSRRKRLKTGTVMRGKNSIKHVIGGLMMTGMAVVLTGCQPDADIMQKVEGGYVINTTKLSEEVVGFEDTTPVKIYISDNRITKVEALSNRETPRYFARVKTYLLPQWNGMEVSQALKTDVDGISGATYSCRAVRENVRLGLEYYRKFKKN